MAVIYYCDLISSSGTSMQLQASMLAYFATVVIYSCRLLRMCAKRGLCINTFRLLVYSMSLEAVVANFCMLPCQVILILFVCYSCKFFITVVRLAPKMSEKMRK
jgi:hypothetical protein